MRLGLTYQRAFCAALSFTLVVGVAKTHGQDRGACVIAEMEEAFRGKSLAIKKVTEVERKEKFFNVKDVFGDGDEVLLGIHPDGHSYLFVGGVHYTPDLFHAYGKIRSGVTNMTDGTILRFKNLPPETIASLKSRFQAQLRGKVKRNTWTVTCYAGVCQQLKASGIKLASDGAVLPSTFLEKIFENGFVDKNGKPISFDIYRTNDVPIQKIHDELKSAQAKDLPKIRVYAVVIGAGVYLFITDPMNPHHRK